MEIKNALKALLVTLIIVSSTQTQAMDSQQAAEEQAHRDEQARLLRTAVRNDNIVEIRALIAAGADLNARDRYGMTVLIGAAIRGRIEIVQALIAAGADLNLQNGYGNTALMEAVSWGRWEIVELIFDALYLREVRKPFLTSHMAINQLEFGPEKKGKIAYPLLRHLKSYVAPELPTYQWLQKKLGRRYYPAYRAWKRTQPGYERFDENFNGAGPA